MSRMAILIAMLTLVAGCRKTGPIAIPGAPLVAPTLTALQPATTALEPAPTALQSSATAPPPPEPTATVPPPPVTLALEPPALPPAGVLTITSPPETVEVSGGGDLRVALYLLDQEGQPVEAAMVQAELWSPGGELFAALPCADQGRGRYLAGIVSLPLRDAGGDWRVVARAAWGDGGQAQAERTFTVKPSISETYQEQFGFWVEPPEVFDLGTGFYNLRGGGGLHFEEWLDEDGGGYVILDNYRYEATGITYLTLEVHWRPVDFPSDEAAAIAYARILGGKGLHHQELETSLMNVSAEHAVFQGLPAWQVNGQYRETYTAHSAAPRPAEWIIFSCPGSDWAWSLVITSSRSNDMNYLRTRRETFICP